MKKFVFFGSGDYGRRALALVPHEWVAFFLDNDPGKTGTKVEGVPICNFTSVCDEVREYRVVVTMAPENAFFVGRQLAAAGISDYLAFSELPFEVTREKIAGRPDFLGIYKKAIEWVQEHSIRDEAGDQAIINNTSLPHAYPEVTGYYIPTLIRWGYRDLALSYAKWLCRHQQECGAWLDTEGVSPYVFDTAQALRGLLAIRELMPEADEHIRRGCEWILTNMKPDGRLTTPDMTDWGSAGADLEVIHIYALAPLLEAADALHEPCWRDEAMKIWNYYKTNHLAQIKDFNMLSHFYAYLMEALLELGEEELAREAMAKVATLQTQAGAVPAYRDVHWICSTGLFQLAMVWFRLGERERGEKAFAYACQMQNPSGGWYGSYLSEDVANECNDYFPSSEISWAVKFFLDALYYKNKADFESSAPRFLKHIDKMDGRYQAVLSHMENRKDLQVLDVGCGRGRYLRNLLEDAPGNYYHGVDISSSVLKEYKNNPIETRQGTLTNIPYPDQSFDVVYTCEAMEHAVDLHSAVREMARVTKSGGKIIIIDKNEEHLGAMEIAPWEQWLDKQGFLDLMRRYCSEVNIEEDVMYDGRQDGVFSAWVGMVK